MKNRLQIAASLALWTAIMPVLASAQKLTAPVAPDAAKTILDAARSAEASANYTGAIREYRRLLEVYANEPTLQAPVYLAMSADAEKAGDATQAKLFSDLSASLDPTLKHKLADTEAKAGGTRGGGSKTDTLLAFATMALQGYTQYRAARQQQQPQQQQMPDPSQQYQQQAQYPPAPYGQQGYQPPQGGQYQQAPGYGDPSAQGQYGQQQGQYQQPQQGQYQQPQQGQYQQPQQAQYQQSNYPPPPSAPYGAPVGYGQQATRGAAATSVKVVYDRSRFGATDHFANACGALLTVDGSNLVFTPGCGEAPRVIPAADIVEVRANATVGREIGAFHILTKKGLYLDVAPAGGDREAGRSDVETLRKGLGLAS